MAENINKHTENGGISVEIEHIFPIIKKWLYSEKEIFLREIVSNACDAITKMKRLISLGEAKNIPEDEQFRITVSLNKTEKTLTVTDNGIGMTEEELRKYICQIALSGALDFIDKYENSSANEDGNVAKNGIIGHFGLGFYSSFMVSDTVDVISKSYTGADSVLWVCEEDGTYEMTTPYEREDRGTSVVMHISDEEAGYLNEYKIKEILNKYCAFMPEEIYFVDEEAEYEEHECECEHDHEDGEECDCEHHKHENKPINDTHPLWLKPASECTDEEYKEFYRKVFNDYKEPLFHIHINADYPLNFKGILYFPRITNEYESLEGQVKLYYNQVFVADNIKEVIPEFLLMLKGVLDCPELPLNVSRSYLQNSGYVSKIQSHIIKKVADKINAMFNTEREEYEKLWRDLKTFVEYGCMRDRKFYDRVKESVLFETTDGRYLTTSEYLDGAKERHENTIYYATDKVAQAQYVSLLEAEYINVVVLDRIIDTQFMNTIENDRSGVKFVRVDADISDALKGDGEVISNDEVIELFKKVSGDEKLKVKFEILKDSGVPAILNISEESRRMDDMMKLYSMSNQGMGTDLGAFPLDATLILNSSSPLIMKVIDMVSDSDKGEKAEKIAKQVYSLSVLSQRKLSADELKNFLSDSFSLLEQID